MGDWYVGEIRLFSMPWNPQYWLLCDGSIRQISTDQALYSLLGTAYGGNGTTTFALPDLRGRTFVGVSQVDATYQRGKTGGAETVPLSTTQIPAHAHTFMAESAAGTGTAISAGVGIASVVSSPFLSPAPNIFAPVGTSAMIPLNPGTVGTTGSTTGHNNLQPSLVLNFCIARSGTYPPRN